MTKEIDEEVKDLLNSFRGEWPAICRQTSISYSWLCKFMRGAAPNPAFSTLRILRDYLRPRAEARAVAAKAEADFLAARAAAQGPAAAQATEQP